MLLKLWKMSEKNRQSIVILVQNINALKYEILSWTPFQFSPVLPSLSKTQEFGDFCDNSIILIHSYIAIGLKYRQDR